MIRLLIFHPAGVRLSSSWYLATRMIAASGFSSNTWYDVRYESVLA